MLKYEIPSWTITYFFIVIQSPSWNPVSSWEMVLSIFDVHCFNSESWAGRVGLIALTPICLFYFFVPLLQGTRGVRIWFPRSFCNKHWEWSLFSAFKLTKGYLSVVRSNLVFFTFQLCFSRNKVRRRSIGTPEVLIIVFQSRNSLPEIKK